MTENQRKPVIRFAEFTDAWEQRKLNEVACLAKGQQINKTKLSDNGEYYVLNGGMTPSGYTSDYNTPENTISISEGGNSCGFVCYNFSKFWSGGHNYTLSNLKIDTKYLFQFLKLKEPSIMALRVGSGLPNVQKSRLEEVKVSYPSVEEQLMIGAYFIQLDNLITLHQREYDKIVNLKKAMLEKMFPKNGEDRPEIRFKGFTDAWEQRKFGNMVNIVERPITIQDSEIYQLVTVRNKNKGVISRGHFQGKDILVKGYFKLKQGDFLISKRQIVHGASGYVPKELDGAVVSNEYLVISSNEHITAEYLSLISKRKDMHKLYFISSYGVDIQKLVFDVSDWKKRLISVPNLPEQDSVVSFFLKIENLITLHQRELKKLQNMKKALLEKMFVQG